MFQCKQCSRQKQPASYEATLCLYRLQKYVFTARYRGGAPSAIHVDKTIPIQPSADKRENNVANIERNNPARRTIFYPVFISTTAREWTGQNNNGGKRCLMTNLRFSFRYRSFSRVLIIVDTSEGISSFVRMRQMITIERSW